MLPKNTEGPGNETAKDRLWLPVYAQRWYKRELHEVNSPFPWPSGKPK